MYDVNDDDVTGQVRALPPDARFGFVYFLIPEDQHRVDLLELIWIGSTTPPPSRCAIDVWLGRAASGGSRR